MPDSLYNTVGEFVAGVLSTVDPSEIVVIAIPSHTRPDKAGNTREVKDQDQWADAALELFAKLFGGATGYRAYGGSYWSDKLNKMLSDIPIMIESLASDKQVSDEKRLQQLAEFALRLARKTDQECVFVAINNTRHYVGRGK